MNFIRSAVYENMAAELIDTEDCLIMLKSDDVRVVVIMSDKVLLDKNNKRIYADCEKIPAKFMWATDADVMITLYSPNIAVLNEDQKRIAMLRELMKINSDTTEGLKKITIQDYDLKDFKLIVDRYGVNWDKETDLFTEVED